MAEEKRFSIGNQTAWFARSITEPFEYAVSNGFDAFEWFPDRKETGEGWSEDELPEETRVYIKDTAAASGIRLSVHVPWRWNPFVQGSGGEMERAIHLARDVGAVLMNIHFYKEQGAAAFARAIGPLAAELSGKGISLSVENTPETEPGDFNELFRLLGARGSKSPGVGMCLDLGHANLCSATRNDYLRYVDLLDEDMPIIHVHLHENYGDADSHLPLFTGPAGRDDSGIKGFIERLKRRGYSGSLILEQWPDPPVLIDNARERLLSIIGIPTGAPVKPKPEVPAGDFAQVIAGADSKRRSWREKLDWVRDLLSDDAPDLTIGQLAYLAIYLRFLGAGQVRVSEDGSHYRPSHHARMAKDIFLRLTEMATPENLFILRQIYPWLPSFDSEFLRSEPLTRIRDIAHRNDIPPELKKEIKTTLQNKLHRNAGPEDLVTSSRLLKRITSPESDYSPSFVDEFRKFHRELTEFFNAASLDERLSSIAEAEGEGEAGLIKHFLDTRNSAESAEELMGVLALLTQLRGLFSDRLRNREGSEAQKLLAADIAMEGFSFVLLSRIINEFRSQESPPWQHALRCLAMTVENLMISGFDREESLAIISESRAWRRDFDGDSRDQLLRLKATVDRSLRLAEAHTGKVLSLFPEKAQRLGHMLRVDRRALKVFAEAEIRRHPVFQLSKLAEFLLKNIRRKASLPPWDVIVPGHASGRLKAASDLSGLPASSARPVIALLGKVEGNEEIPAGVTAIIVPHEMPHLSHLAVRARQGGVVFAICEDKDLFSDLHILGGKTVSLDAKGENVGYNILRGPAQEHPRPSPAAGIRIPAAVMTAGKELLEIEHINLEHGGGKAFWAKRLMELSLTSRGLFKTPRGKVIPFGALEESLRERPELEKEYRSLTERLDRPGTGGKQGIPVRIREIIAETEAPEGLAAAVERTFGPRRRLMVRSSSNCEDLEGLSGAGLYETVANVSADGAGDAVKSVWASLWTERAVTSRGQLGIPHKSALMAVLIQEMIVPEYSFIIHTANPVTGGSNEVYVELAKGLGEALASNRLPGTPYRMVCDKHTGEVRMLSFASFSHAFVPGPAGEMSREVMDYARVSFSTDEKARMTAGERLMSIAVFVEKGLGKPQDIEGVISGDEIYLVQTRPQQGVR